VIPSRRLRWTCKSVRRLAQGACEAQGHEVSRTLVRPTCSNKAGYSLQGNPQGTTEGRTVTPTGMRSSAYINTQVTTALAERQPVDLRRYHAKGCAAEARKGVSKWKLKSVP